MDADLSRFFFGNTHSIAYGAVPRLTRTDSGGTDETQDFHDYYGYDYDEPVRENVTTHTKKYDKDNLVPIRYNLSGYEALTQEQRDMLNECAEKHELKRVSFDLTHESSFMENILEYTLDMENVGSLEILTDHFTSAEKNRGDFDEPVAVHQTHVPDYPTEEPRTFHYPIEEPHMFHYPIEELHTFHVEKCYDERPRMMTQPNNSVNVIANNDTAKNTSVMAISDTGCYGQSVLEPIFKTVKYISSGVTTTVEREYRCPHCQRNVPISEGDGVDVFMDSILECTTDTANESYYFLSNYCNSKEQLENSDDSIQQNQERYTRRPDYWESPVATARKCYYGIANGVKTSDGNECRCSHCHRPILYHKGQEMDLFLDSVHECTADIVNDTYSFIRCHATEEKAKRLVGKLKRKENAFNTFLEVEHDDYRNDIHDSNVPIEQDGTFLLANFEEEKDSYEPLATRERDQNTGFMGSHCITEKENKLVEAIIEQEYENGIISNNCITEEENESVEAIIEQEYEKGIIGNHYITEEENESIKAVIEQEDEGNDTIGKQDVHETVRGMIHLATEQCDDEDILAEPISQEDNEIVEPVKKQEDKTWTCILDPDYWLATFETVKDSVDSVVHDHCQDPALHFSGQNLEPFLNSIHDCSVDTMRDSNNFLTNFFTSGQESIHDCSVDTMQDYSNFLTNFFNPEQENKSVGALTEQTDSTKESSEAILTQQQKRFVRSYSI